MIGLEAGQSAFGDVFAWFANLLAWPSQTIKPAGVDEETAGQYRKGISGNLLDALNAAAAEIPPSETGLLALDWLNGRRTPDADQNLKGAVIGLRLGTTAPKIYRALVEATAFGSKATLDRFKEEGVEIREAIALGGISLKSPFVMQVTADVLNMPIKVATSEQTCALGAAMFGAAAAGLYKTVEEAQSRMGSGFSRTYQPDPKRAALYGEMYRKYLALGKSLEDQLRCL
jgi:L-ribulokinase